MQALLLLDDPMKHSMIGIYVAIGSTAAVASDIPPPRPVDVAAIVRQLGSEDFIQREKVSRRLSTLSVDEPPPELLSAQKSPNAEIRDRARRAVAALNKHIVRERETALPRPTFLAQVCFARRGQVDLDAASTAANKLKTQRRPSLAAGV